MKVVGYGRCSTAEEASNGVKHGTGRFRRAVALLEAKGAPHALTRAIPRRTGGGQGVALGSDAPVRISEGASSASPQLECAQTRRRHGGPASARKGKYFERRWPATHESGDL